jgi:hypothetical protein
MKVAIIEVPYPFRLVLPMEKLGALEFSYLVKGEGYGSSQEFTVADPAERIEIAIYDTSEIKPFQPPVVEVAQAPTPSASADDRMPF